LARKPPSSPGRAPQPARTAGASGGDALVITVKVKPRSPVSELLREASGEWVARLKSPPVDGKANAELIALIAQRFGCAKAAVSIVSGASARTKRVRLAGVARIPGAS
jgi:uncharacterized protein (TIGR00251 family)